jgi:hypothetical protein
VLSNSQIEKGAFAQMRSEDMFRTSFASWTLAAAVAFPALTPANPTLSLDLDGPLGPKPSRQFTPNGLLDFLEGNAIIQDAYPVLLGQVPAAGTVLQSYYQTLLSVVRFNNGQLDTLLNTTKEITAQMAAPLEVQGITTGRMDVALGNTGVNFFRLFFDPTKDSNIPSGLGFDGSGDAQLILEAQFDSIDFLIALSLTSTSTFIGTGIVTYYDPGFFTPDIAPSQIEVSFLMDGLIKVPR